MSSQFISALFISCPRLKNTTTLIIKGKKIVSQTYLTITRQVLQKSGIIIRKLGHRTFQIRGNQQYKGLKEFVVPSDYGLAAFHMAAAALLPSEVTLIGFLENSFIPADGQILGFLKKMGVQFIKTSTEIRISGPFSLKGGSFSLKDCPDLVPIMAILALFVKGRTRLKEIRHARVKESNRISDLRKELLKIGAKIQERQNELIIDPQEHYQSDCVLDPHRDHRLAMAFCILGLKIGVFVKDIECISKSYPGFLRDLKKLHAHIRKL
jgi:3-phosphoshikimate 1-carboxyvinyltransferase